MNTKLLVGSIVSVVIIILVSFTSVVGYRSISSDVKASPLFTIRTSRAIKQYQDALKSDYLGKDKVRTLLFPDRGNRQVLFQSIINQISMLDDKKFNNFVKLFVNHLHNKYKLNDADIEDTLGFLYQLRDSKSQLSDFNIGMTKDTPWTEYPICTIACTIDRWVPTCIYEEIWFMFFFFITGILCFIGILTTGPPGP